MAIPAGKFTSVCTNGLTLPLIQGSFTAVSTAALSVPHTATVRSDARRCHHFLQIPGYLHAPSRAPHSPMFMAQSFYYLCSGML